MSLRWAIVWGSLVVVGFRVAHTSGQANDSFVGTWTLNAGKSTLAGIMGDLPRANTITFERLADGGVANNARVSGGSGFLGKWRRPRSKWLPQQ